MICNTCGKKNKKTNEHNMKFPSTVIEINNPEQLVLLRKVVIPASISETIAPPIIGKYRNVILQYEDTGNIYLYSSDGIPTKLESSVPQELLNRISALETEIDGKQDELTPGENITIEDESGDLVISSTGGGIKELSTTDYNWNTTTNSAVEPFDSIAFWLLDTGIYITEEFVRIAEGTNINGSTGFESGVVMELNPNSTSQKTLVILGRTTLSWGQPGGNMTCYGQIRNWSIATGERNFYNAILSNNNVNDLSGSSTNGILAASTGKNIKDKVDSISGYSSAETNCGSWVNGDTMYKKTIEIPALPNATIRHYSIGETGITKIIKLEGFYNSGTDFYPLPYTGVQNVNNVSLYSSLSNIYIDSGSQDMSSMSGYVTVYYTKSS